MGLEKRGPKLGWMRQRDRRDMEMGSGRVEG